MRYIADLFMPADEPVRMGTMTDPRRVPYHPDNEDMFTVERLAHRVHAGNHENWLRANGLELVEIAAPEGWTALGTWYRLQYINNNNNDKEA